MAGRYNLPNAQPSLGVNGQVEPGARALFFQPGTGTARQVFTDYALTVPHTQPILSDASGRWPDIFDTAGARADVRWETPAGVLIDLMPDVIATASSDDFITPATLQSQIAPILPWNGGLNYKAGDKVTSPAFSTVWRASAANFNAQPGVAGVWVKELGFEGGVLTQELILAGATTSAGSLRFNTSLSVPTTPQVGQMGCNGGALWVILNTGAGVFTHTVLTNLTRRAYRTSLPTYRSIPTGAGPLNLDNNAPTTTTMPTELLFLGAGIGQFFNRFRITASTHAFVPAAAGGPQILGIGLFVDGVCIASAIESIAPGQYRRVAVSGEFAPSNLNGRSYGVRVGTPSSNTALIYLNGNDTGAGALHGGTLMDSIELVEIGGF